MRLEAVGHPPDSPDVALERAARYVQSRGYRPVARAADLAVFERGSILGTMTGMTPARWAARLEIRRIDAADVGMVVDANDDFQMVTESEKAFWAREVAGLLEVVEDRDPTPESRQEPPRAAAARAARTVAAHAAAASVAGLLLGAAARLAARLVFPLFGWEIGGEWWTWPAVGAVLGGGVALTNAVASPEVLEMASRVAGSPEPEGEALQAPPRPRQEAGHPIEGVVVVLDQDYEDCHAFVANHLRDSAPPDAPVRIAVHAAATDEGVARSIAIRQMLIAGVAVDHRRFRYAPVEAPSGRVGTVVHLRGEPGRPPPRLERFDASTAIILVPIFAMVSAFGLWMVWEGVSRGRDLGSTDRGRLLHLVVESKAEAEDGLDRLGGLRVRGRIRETGERGDVAVFRSEFDRAAPGGEIGVFRRREGEPLFVSTRRYGESAPITPIPRLPVSWHFHLGAIMVVLGATGAYQVANRHRAGDQTPGASRTTE